MKVATKHIKILDLIPNFPNQKDFKRVQRTNRVKRNNLKCLF